MYYPSWVALTMVTIIGNLIWNHLQIFTSYQRFIVGDKSTSDSALRSIPQDLIVEKSQLDQVVVWSNFDIGIDTNIEVIVVSLTTWEAHHSPRAKPEGCGELPRSLMRQQWPKLRYQFLFYHDETKFMLNKQILSI